MSDNKRSRGWCFTINNYSQEDEHYVFDMANSCTYVVCGKEYGEQNETPHLQGFVYYPTLTSFAQVKLVHPTAHWEPMRGTVTQAAEYCKKEGDYFESGVCPMGQKEKGECGKQSIAERWALVKEGKFDELPPEHIKTYKYIYQSYRVVQDRTTLDNIWLQGPSGCGKSRYVRDTYPEFYSKPMSKWWDGYNGESVVLIDDYAPEHTQYLGYYLKIWADHYAFQAEVKGGMYKIRPLTIIITSQYTKEACFLERETYEAISRRFRTVELGPLNPNNISPLLNLTKH